MSSLQQLATAMVTTSKHRVLYKHFFALVRFLLTPPVKSASCERAHSKVDIVKSAVRESMTSERLDDLILISSENLSVVIDKFAASGRALRLKVCK